MFWSFLVWHKNVEFVSVFWKTRKVTKLIDHLIGHKNAWISNHANQLTHNMENWLRPKCLHKGVFTCVIV